MSNDEKDPLWHLLGKAKQPEVSPFFSRNVLRAIRQMEQKKPAPIAWLRWSWRMALGAAAALTVFASVQSGHQKKEADSTALLTRQIVNNPDYEVIENLDELLAYENSSIWLDDSTNSTN